MNSYVLQRNQIDPSASFFYTEILNNQHRFLFASSLHSNLGLSKMDAFHRNYYRHNLDILICHQYDIWDKVRNQFHNKLS